MISVVNGYTDKPIACQKLIGFFLGQEEISGYLYVGYPFIYPLGLVESSQIDCLLISPEKGLVAFNLIEKETIPQDYVEKQEDVYHVIEWNLKSFAKLLKKRKLMVDINIVTFSPNAEKDLLVEEGYLICNEQTLGTTLANIAFDRPELYDEISKAVRTIGKPVQMIARKPLIPGSRGELCAELEKKSVFILDHSQIRAAMETIEGVQRIRGLSGSGKSAVLALKAAYIHACHPEWKIGLTFNTFSSRVRYQNAINFFYRKQTGSNPNWDNITICIAWGNKNGKDKTLGMYQLYTDINSTRFYDYKIAEAKLGITDPFGEVCERSLYDTGYDSKEIFDIIIIDEAQEFPVDFMRICHKMLRDPKRLVYTYDDMQNFRPSLPPPEEIFGNGDNGMPVAGIYEDNADIVLGGCYERPPAILSTAHALAFGIYREHPKGEINPVQMFENIHIWNELGYKVVDGCLDYGKHVVIGRVSTDDKLSDIDIDDQIVFKSFESEEEHGTWVAQEIIRNVTEDGMQARDIMIVVTAAQLLYKGTSVIRDKLSNEKISCHIVGDDNPGDEFWKGESVAVANLFKARSNEAPMVYVVHAQNALFTKYDAVLIRNCLYSAITRSTAWVRVVGVGEEMDSLVEEYERIKSKVFLFDFVYPNRYNNLNIAYRETIEDIFVSDPLYLDKMVANIMELIRLGKTKLDEEQYCLLKEWISVRKKQ